MCVSESSKYLNFHTVQTFLKNQGSLMCVCMAMYICISLISYVADEMSMWHSLALSPGIHFKIFICAVKKGVAIIETVLEIWEK